jgi:tetratricopeptide (TPR) repeat protein
MEFNINEKSILLSDKAMECCLNGNFENALKYFDEGLSVDEDNILLLYNKAGCLVNMGEIEQSDPIFKKIIGLCDEMDKSELVLNIKANSYTYLRDFDSAREVFEEILKDFPNNVDGQLSRAIYLKRECMYDDSLEVFRKVLNLDPDNFEANMYMGELLLDLGGHEECKKFIDKAFELCPDFPYILYIKGCYFAAVCEDYKKAIEYYDKAINIEPGLVKCYFEKSKCLVLLGKADEAKKSFNKIYELNPEFYDESNKELLDDIIDMLANHYFMD